MTLRAFSHTAERVEHTGAAPPLDRITGDSGSFLSDSWSVCACVFPSSDARGGFTDLLAFEDVDRLVSTTSPRTPTFRLVKAGSQIPESSYTRSGRTGSKPVSGMADPARIADLFRDGATIVLQGLHRYHEPVARFCRDLELQLGHPCQANAYVTPAGAQGLALHADPHDVFVLQAFGRKRWEVRAAPGEPDRAPIDADVAPGDSIYMPTGTPHAASTQETLSGHLTIGVHVTSWREVLASAWRRVEQDPAFDEPVPAAWHRDKEACAVELKRRLTNAAKAMGALDATELANERERRFLSTRAQLMRGVLQTQQELDRIEDGTLLRRRQGSVCEPRAGSDHLVVLLGDRRLEMPVSLEPAMRLIGDSDAFRPRDLAGVMPHAQSRLVLVRRLVREGLLTPDEPGAR